MSWKSVVFLSTLCLLSTSISAVSTATGQSKRQLPPYCFEDEAKACDKIGNKIVEDVFYIFGDKKPCDEFLKCANWYKICFAYDANLLENMCQRFQRGTQKDSICDTAPAIVCMVTMTRAEVFFNRYVETGGKDITADICRDVNVFCKSPVDIVCSGRDYRLVERKCGIVLVPTTITPTTTMTTTTTTSTTTTNTPTTTTPTTTTTIPTTTSPTTTTPTTTTPKPTTSTTTTTTTTTTTPKPTTSTTTPLPLPEIVTPACRSRLQSSYKDTYVQMMYGLGYDKEPSLDLRCRRLRDDFIVRSAHDDLRRYCGSVDEQMFDTFVAAVKRRYGC